MGEPGPIRSIVVGLDGSLRSINALRWAQELAGTEAEVKAVMAWTQGVGVHLDAEAELYPVSTPVIPYDILEDAARRDLDRALARVPAGGVARSIVLRHSFSPSMALREEAAEADVLVIGTRHHSRLERVFDSVAIECAQGSPCPVIAVPEGAVTGGNVVAVAFDGSGSSRAAVTWALAFSASLGAGLRVITVSRHTNPSVEQLCANVQLLSQRS